MTQKPSNPNQQDGPHPTDSPGAAGPSEKQTPAGAEGSPAASGAETNQTPENEVEQLRADLAEVTDRALRAQAELENYRRRVARQMDEERRYAQMPLLRDLLPVLDNMYRAIEAAEKAEEAPALLEGFRMVANQLKSVLSQHDCTEIEALGAPFDPHLHEAISQQPTADHPPGTVLMVTQTGFRLHDRVVRPSKVIVSCAPPEPQDSASGN